MSRKGITDIIAIVLLLMITISMIGFAWLWFNRLQSTVINKTETGIATTQKTANQQIFIDNLDKVTGTVTIRNIGSYDIPANLITVYSGGASVFCAAGSTLPASGIPVGQTKTCINLTSLGTAGCTSNVMVSAPGNKDQISC